VGHVFSLSHEGGLSFQEKVSILPSRPTPMRYHYRLAVGE
jgi:hypothetical protein